ncbi:shikimate kinase [Paraburkholderia phytofirmans]|uniref:shikimate kinase n=1 Tax=Paraburkholderia phytofirmans TaxID=261302 RepID=UPI0038B8A712
MKKSGIELRELNELVDAVLVAPDGLIAFDGCLGAGKTTLATAVAKGLGRPMVDFDDYIEREKGHFVGALDITRLKSKLDAEFAQSDVVLASGACMQEVLMRMGYTAALNIYVQRNTSAGLAGDQDFLDVEDGYEPHPDILHFWTPLDHEIFAYHRKHRPKANANIIFVRVSD